MQAINDVATQAKDRRNQSNLEIDNIQDFAFLDCELAIEKEAIPEIRTRLLELKAVFNGEKCQYDALNVFEAMTPSNFDWIYAELQRVLMIMAWEPEAICWLLAMDLPINAFNYCKLAKQLTEKLLQEEKISLEVYGRLSRTICWFKTQSKEELRLESMEYFRGSAFLTNDQEAEINQEIKALKEKLAQELPSDEFSILKAGQLKDIRKISDKTGIPVENVINELIDCGLRAKEDWEIVK